MLATFLCSPLATTLVIGPIATLLLPDQRADSAQYWTVFASIAYFYFSLSIVKSSAKLTKDHSTIGRFVIFAAAALGLLGFSSVFVSAIQRRGGSEFQAILPIIFAMQTAAVLAHTLLKDAHANVGEGKSHS